MIPRPMNGREWLMLVALSVLWGGSFFYHGIIVPALPSFTIVLLRAGIAALALLVVVRVLGVTVPLGRAALLTYVGMGLLNNVIPQVLIVWAQKTIPSGLASILNGTTPFFTVLVLHLFTTSEKATPLRVLGVAVGFLGVATMIGVDLLAGLGDNLLPQLASLAAACSYGFSTLWGRRFAQLGIPPLAAATGQLAAAGLMLAPLALLVDRPWTLPMPGPGVWLAVLALALLSSALAYILFFRIMATAGATNLALVTFLVPVSAIILGILFLGETLQPKQIAGMALIGIGLACIDGRLPARLGPLIGLRR